MDSAMLSSILRPFFKGPPSNYSLPFYTSLVWNIILGRFPPTDSVMLRHTSALRYTLVSDHANSYSVLHLSSVG